MYPVRIGFEEVLSRIRKLRDNSHYSEALVTSIFTLEKLMRRSMRIAIVARGFTSKHADKILWRKGFSELKELWNVFDIQHRNLPELVGNRIWQHIPKCVEMRNKLVHGNRTFDLSSCQEQLRHVLDALTALHAEVKKSYQHDPWERIQSRRTPRLQWLPKRIRLFDKGR